MSDKNSLKDMFKKIYYDSRIFLKHGTTSPEYISIAFTDREICVDPNDPRARKKLVIKSDLHGRSSRNQNFWRTTIDAFSPQTALDIGFNYGECMLSRTYDSNIRLFAFEANSQLAPFIEKSLSTHPNRQQIECRFNLVGDTTEPTEFWIDKEWSGCSSAARPDSERFPDKYELKTVESITIDQTLASSHCEQERLFFKLDVEGYEYRVLLGMQETLVQTSEMIGFVEFDPQLLERAGEDVTEYWEFLRAEFEVYAFQKNESWQSFQHFRFEDLKFLCGEKIHTDLVLIKSNDPHELDRQLREAWKLTRCRKAAA